MISIVVPVYNVEKFLRQCVDSVLAQTFRDFELILVDDGSTDGSGEICDQYASQDARIRVIHQRNEGVASARNAGLDVLSGEYAFFVDSDDYLHEKTLETALRALTENDADIAFSDFEKVDACGKTIATSAATAPADGDAVFTPETAVKKLAGDNAFIWNVVWNKLYKAELLKGIRFPLVKMCEDDYFTYKAIFASTRLAYVAQKLYRYRQNRQSLTLGNDRRFVGIFAIEGKLEQTAFFEKKQLLEALEISTRSCFDMFCANLAAYRPDAPEDRRRIAKSKRTLRRFVWKFRKDYRLAEILYFEQPKLFLYLRKWKNRLKRV